MNFAQIFEKSKRKANLAAYWIYFIPRRTNTYHRTPSGILHNSYIFHISIFPDAHFLFLMFSHLVFIVHCATTLAPAPRRRRVQGGSTLRLATTARFYITIGKKSNSVRSTTCWLSHVYTFSERCNIFFLFRICEKEICLR